MEKRKKLILPDTFIEEMQQLFCQFGRETEWPAFLDSFQQEADGGLRANTLKISVDELKRLLAKDLEGPADQFKAVTWSADGLYYPDSLQPGRLPHYSAGLYYIQEPSAMLPAQVLAAKPGERILDLCAAPGGKTCRIAADLKGQGLLWANEISAERARALLRNVELTGCTNCLITQETPERLAERLPGFFDRILVDAPCSGSGMFRRDPSAIESWKAYGSQHCVGLQQTILQSAWSMLKPGGIMVYSTCTFSIAENESMIVWLTEQQPDCRILPIDKAPGVSDGLPIRPDLTGTARIWPHLANGDGHFCALLKKAPAAVNHPESETVVKDPALTKESRLAWASFWEFCEQNLTDFGVARLNDMCRDGRQRYDHDCLHILPEGVAAPERLKKVKTGLFLGQVKILRDQRRVYEPSPAFLLSLSAEDLRYQASGSAASDLIKRYLRGETISWPEFNSIANGRFAAVALSGGETQTQGWPLGWVKIQMQGQLKNLYPQAWRRQV